MKPRFRYLFFLAAAALLASSALSLALQGAWARRSLTARLSASFGRPVEVGRFAFSLLNGFRLQAQSVTVAEDPRFGNEYFLRADELTASIHWTALAAGRFEFDTVSLSHPSLNLVRLGDGRWNIESWLAPLPLAPRGRSASAISVAAPQARISRIEIDSGRINFKRDARKLPLALVNVRGRLDYDGAGRWNLDLQANPLRAPVALQQAGVLRLQGVAGGVSARLRPAAFQLAWQDVSLADFSRLLFGADYGLRGNLDGRLSAHVAGSPEGGSATDWIIDGTISLQHVHGWAVPARDGDPAVSAAFHALWNPSLPRLQIRPALLESAQSRASLSLDLDWSAGFRPDLRIWPAHFAFADVFAWRRAFSPAMESIRAEGALEAQLAASGWPLRIESLSLQSDGGAVFFPPSPPVRIGKISAGWSDRFLRLRPLAVDIAPLSPPESASRLDRQSSRPDGSAKRGSFQIEGIFGPFENLLRIGDCGYRLSVFSDAARAEDLAALAAAWRGASSSWKVTGPLSLRFSFKGGLQPASFQAEGVIQARNAQITSPLLNSPLLVSSAVMEFRGGQRRITIGSAAALGTRWFGFLRKSGDNPVWDFDLSAGQLNASDFTAWLGASPSPNLLRRMLPFVASAGASESKIRMDALAALRARGRLRLGQLTFSPLIIERLDSQAIFEGNSLLLRQGRASVFGGQLSGDFQARLAPAPSFSFDGRFSRLELARLAQLAVLPGEITGLASGEVSLAAAGSDRSAILRSLAGQVDFRASELSSQLRWPEAAPAAFTDGSSPSSFSAAGSLRIGNSRVLIDNLRLFNAAGRLDISGAIAFSRTMDLRVQTVPRVHKFSSIAAAAPSAWSLSGTLDSPQIAIVKLPGSAAETPLARR